ncbi:putative small GTP-binding protein Rab11, putative,Rab11 GTPase [Trypanosoma theileri]|uniref:Ras-related protein Rab n=1 Tax=Trypanosoma theileri TaxID=67003 RepID=A0A1X0NTV9_9TRYP|nr:putative small GTP-binding protein Rab11, putative,Rab11 GTPase [Trypanosoma theileri]ORC87550.1 putative small GTP-binding protein Rab11, putative,Rab11 GTPase [Trypanosoma theileri]
MSSYAKGGELLFKVLIIGEGGTGKTCLIRRYVHSIFLPTNKATIGVDFALKDVVYPPTHRSITLQLWDIAGQERYGQMTRVYYQAAAGAIVVADITRPETLELAVKWKQDVDSKVFLGATGKPIPCVLLINKVDLLPNGMLVTSVNNNNNNNKKKKNNSTSANNSNSHNNNNNNNNSNSSSSSGDVSMGVGSNVGIQKTKEEMDAFCSEHGFEAWFLTSAKENRNVDVAFMTLVECVMKATGALESAEDTAESQGNNESGRILHGNRTKREEKSGCSC